MEMTIKEYAESRKITYEAVAKQVREYKKKDLKKHINYQGRTAYLDDYAIDFLDQHRQKRNTLLYPTNKEIEEEMARLRNQILNLQEELVKRSDSYAKLLEEHSKTLEDKARTDTLLLLADKEHEELEQAKQELSKYQRTIFGLYKKVD
jgi:chromosome segregation ATPase